MKSLLSMTLVAFSLVACHSAPKLAPAVSSTGTQGGLLRQKVGSTFTVSLEANHTTGYSWSLDGKEDSKVVRKVSNDYVSDTHLPGMVGYGGTENWEFRAERPGRTVLHFVYRRPWEKDGVPGQERSIKVVVE